jgi:hypothetical protein
VREQIRKMIASARRVSRTNPAEPFQPNGSSAAPNLGSLDEGSLGAHAIRVARIAATLHLDQAARLRAQVAQHNARATHAHSETVEVTR